MIAVLKKNKKKTNRTSCFSPKPLFTTVTLNTRTCKAQLQQWSHRPCSHHCPRADLGQSLRPRLDSHTAQCDHFLEPYDEPGRIPTRRFQISQHHALKDKNELYSPNQVGGKARGEEISYAEILRCQMFLSSHGLIASAPMPRIITCHQQQCWHLLPRLSEMPAQLKPGEKGTFIGPWPQLKKDHLKVDLYTPRAVPLKTT